MMVTEQLKLLLSLGLSLGQGIFVVFLFVLAFSGTVASESSVFQDMQRLAVLNESQNAACFRESILEFDQHGNPIEFCHPGYRREQNEEHCRKRCCVCEHGTYQPHPNNCPHCVQKTFCPDYGLEFEDNGSINNNSKCRAIMTTTENIPNGGQKTAQGSFTTVNDPQAADKPKADIIGTTEELSNNSTRQHPQFPFVDPGSIPWLISVFTAALIIAAIVGGVVCMLVIVCCWRLRCCTKPRGRIIEFIEQNQPDWTRSSDRCSYTNVNRAVEGKESVNLNI